MVFVFPVKLVFVFSPFFFGAVSANAAEFEVKNSEQSKPAIVTVVGELRYGDQKLFIKKTIDLDSAIVIFHSPGGSIIAGVEIGKAIRLKNFNTYVPKDMLCASACAIAWLGGTKRFMSSTAKIGFHAAYRVEDGKTSESGMANAIVGGYLNSLGLSQDAIAFVTAAAPNSMQWLNQKDAREYGIDVALLNEQSVSEVESYKKSNGEPNQEVSPQKEEAPALTDDNPATAPQQSTRTTKRNDDCDEEYVKANAIFIHATVECNKNYMDTPAGYYALAMARKCNVRGTSYLMNLTKRSMLEFDKVKEKKGVDTACRWADNVAASVNSDRPN
jgi:hypothetical protein